MKRATLELLFCPGCHAELRLCGEGSDETVEEGFLLCPSCEQRFPIEGGLPRFIRPEELEGLNRRFARFYDWLSHMYTLFTKVAFLPMGGERKARKEILDRLELNGGRVLEVSIGPGINSLSYLSRQQWMMFMGWISPWDNWYAVADSSAREVGR